MPDKSFQDYYPDDTAHCYGCGRLNEYGLHIQSYWDADSGESIAHFLPRPYHTAVPGYVYGGLLASLIDCHATGTDAAAAYRAVGREMGSEPAYRYVTASLQVDYHRPTPLGIELEVRARPLEIKGRKVVVEAWILAEGEVCVRGRVICVQMPENLGRQSDDPVG